MNISRDGLLYLFCVIRYSMDQMFEVVADVEKYKNFVPYCKSSVVTSRTATHLRADLVVGFPPLVESYTSSVLLTKPNLVQSVCTEGNLFNHLLTVWKFSPGLKETPRHVCLTSLYLLSFGQLFTHSFHTFSLMK